MIFLEPIRVYLEINVLIIIAFLSFPAVLSFTGRRLEARTVLRAGQVLLVACLFFPLVMRLIPRQNLLPPSAQVFSSARPGAAALALVPVARKKTATIGEASAFVLSNTWVDGFLAFLLVTTLLLAVRFLFRVWHVWALIRALPRIRRVGRVAVLASDTMSVPFSAGFGYRAFVVIPTSLLVCEAEYRMAVRHEIQHLRQRDIEWLYLEELLRIIFFWNPAIHFWNRWIHQYQEFACDAFLLDRRKVSALAYGRCLLRVAESVLQPGRVLVGTASMAAGTRGNLLKRRIEMILNPPNRQTRQRLSTWLGLGTLVLIASSSFASRSALQNGEISMDEARRFAATASEEGGIALVVNDLVLAQLNYYLGTPHGRQFIRNSLFRMPAYEPLIERKLAQYGLPKELMAIPMIESGYVNQSQVSKEDSEAPGFFRGAGIWMFIEPTARRYGLTVTPIIDERLDIEKETDAAMRYFRHLHGMFKNWELAIAGYNQGENYVQKQMNQTGIHDPWELAKQAKINEYLSKAMAAMIILKSPALHPR